MITSRRPEQWDTYAGKFREVVDGTGMPIDDGIFDTVVALNMLGFQTVRSCAGHCDTEVNSSPWVRIISPAAQTLNEEAYQVFAQGQIPDERPDVVPLYLQETLQQGHLLRQKADLLVARQLGMLLGHIDAFYRHMHTTQLTSERVVATMDTPYMTLCVLGGALVPTYALESQVSHIHAHQREMRKFTDYLIQQI